MKVIAIVLRLVFHVKHRVGLLVCQVLGQELGLMNAITSSVRPHQATGVNTIIIGYRVH